MNTSRNGVRCYRALATDEDGTLTRAGHLGAATKAALERLRASGRKIFLTTGETPKDLVHRSHLELFDLIIAENGALLLNPHTKKEHLLAEPPPAKVVRALQRAGVQ